LLHEWGACERSHGVTHQADPTVDANGVIWVMQPPGVQAVGNLHELTGTCSQYLAEARNILRAANPVPPPPDQVELLKYVNCMRANGVPDYPTPQGDTTNFIGSGADPYSPVFLRANQLCGKKIGAPAYWINGTSTPGDVEVGTAGAGTPPTPPSCVFSKVDPCSGKSTRPSGATPSSTAGVNG
jgi:hypothetical protein